MTELSPRQVFISYSRRDGDVTQRIVSLLRKQGFDVWLDNEKLIPGTPIWETEIEKAIKRASAIVVILSPDSKNSEWVRREISLADQYRKRVFPVLVRGDEESSISLRLINRQYVDIRENETARLMSLTNAISGYIKELNSDQEENVKETASLQNTSQETVSSGINNNIPSPRDNQGILWNTLGWAISGLISGFIYSEYDMVANGAIGALIGGAIGGLVTYFALQAENILASQKNRFRVVFAWAIGGIIGWAIGWELTEAIGAGIGMAIFAIIGITGSLKWDYILSNWNRVAVATLGWAIGGAIGWAISKGLIDGLSVEQALSWAIGTAIGWAIGGYVLGGQLLKDKSVKTIEANAREINSAKLNTSLLTDTQKAFLLSWKGRSLIGVMVGLILGILYGVLYGIIHDISYDFAYAYLSFSADVPHIVLLVACGLAGLIAYPQKFSVILMITGFFVAAIIITGLHWVPWYGDSPIENIIISGGLFGIPTGALISRILGESNKIGRQHR